MPQRNTEAPVAGSQQRFQPGDDDRQIMLRYLALVYRLRDQTPGAVLPARVDDLDILAQVFGTDPDHVQHELESLMVVASREIRSESSWIRLSSSLWLARTSRTTRRTATSVKASAIPTISRCRMRRGVHLKRRSARASSVRKGSGRIRSR